ncbi:MAG: DUF6328 family protein [Thermomicrobiales bacterium]
MNVRALPHQQDHTDGPKQGTAPKPPENGKNAPDDLSDMLEETRILLPGTQIFAGFLITLPFQSRFEKLTTTQRNLYLVIFVAVLLSLVCFIMPAAYHRVARPVHRKQGFKVLATRVVIVGLVPFSISTLLSTYLIMDVVVGPRVGVIAACIIGVPLILLWWLFPLFRVHDRVATPEVDG